MKAIRLTIIHELFAAWGFVQREFNLCKRFWKWEAVFLIYTFVNALSIGYIVPGMALMQGTEVSEETIHYMIVYLLIGSLMWGFLAVIFDEVSQTISWERWEGTIEYTFMAPISRMTHLFAICFYSIVYGLLKTLVVLAMVSLFFEISFASASFSGAFLILMMASMSFVGLGIFAAVLPMLSPEKGIQVSKILQALILMVSGIYYPVTILPNWMQSLAVFSPATYALDGIRRALLEGASPAELLPTALTLGAIGIVLVPMGLLTFAAGENYAKRTGLLKRNG